MVTGQKLDSAWPPFHGPQALAHYTQAVANKKPESMTFSAGHEPVEPPVICKIFKYIFQKYAQGQQKINFISKIDFTGIVINESIAELICDKFEVKRLYLKKTTRQFEQKFLPEGMQELYVSENEYFLGKSLIPVLKSQLKKLSLEKCQRVHLELLAKFVEQSETLKILSIIDCVSSFRRDGLTEFMQVIFSHR